MELKISDIQEIQPVSFNFEELKNELIEKSEHYKTAVYTEETIAVAKQDRANLNKLVKAVNDEKIRVKNKILEPYTKFETQCKELMEIVKDATENIDKQIKDFEQKKRDEKLNVITSYFAEKVGIYKDLINFDLIFNERWLNVTYEMKQVQSDIDHVIAKTQNDLMTIDAIVRNEETNSQVRDFYFRNINNPSVLGASLEEAKLVVATPEEQQEFMKRTIYRPKGCFDCNNEGFVGRIGCYEVMLINKEIKKMIAHSAHDVEIEEAAVGMGMKTLQTSCLGHILRGETTISEYLRVLGPVNE